MVLLGCVVFSGLFQTFLNTALHSSCEILSYRVIYSRVCFGVWLPCGCYHKVSSGLSRIILLRLLTFLVKKDCEENDQIHGFQRAGKSWEAYTSMIFQRIVDIVDIWKLANIHMHLHQELHPSRAAFVDRLHHVQFSKAVPLQILHQMRLNAAFISRI